MSDYKGTQQFVESLINVEKQVKKLNNNPTYAKYVDGKIDAYKEVLDYLSWKTEDQNEKPIQKQIPSRSR